MYYTVLEVFGSYDDNGAAMLQLTYRYIYANHIIKHTFNPRYNDTYYGNLSKMSLSTHIQRIRQNETTATSVPLNHYLLSNIGIRNLADSLSFT